MRSTITLLSTVLFVGSFSSQTFANNVDIKNVSISPFISLMRAKNVDSLNYDPNLLSYGIDLTYRYKPHHGIRVGIEKNEIKNTNNSINYHAFNTELMYYPSDNLFDLYLFSGLKVYQTEKQNEALTAGIGYQYSLDNDWKFRIETSGTKLFKDSSIAPAITLALSYQFGQKHYAYKPKTRKYNKTMIYKDKPVSITLDVKFAHNSSIITQSYDKELMHIADFLTKYNNTTITIHGHTSLPGTNAYNMILSKNRATAVANKLIHDYQISPKRIFTVGHGENDPIINNESVKANKINRRVVATIKAIEKIKTYQ